MFEVILRTKGLRVDITEYVDEPAPQSKNVGDVFGSATIIIPYVEKDVIKGLDLSQEIAEMSIIEITDIEDKRQYYVVQDDVLKRQNEYQHSLELKSVELLFTFRPISDNSATQPVEEGRVFVNELSGIKNELFYGYTYGGIVPFTTTSVSADFGVIEDRVLKQNGEYKISLDIQILGGWMIDELLDIKVLEIRIDSEVYSTSYFGINKNNAKDKRVFTIKHDNISENEIEVYIEYSGTESHRFNATLEVMYEEVEAGRTIYLDEVVEKALRLTSVNVSEFVLDSNTKSKLALVKAFDDNLTDTTLYEALNRVANYVKAKVRLTIDFQKNEKLVWFEFYDDLSDVEFVGVNNDEENILSNVNKLTSAFELKNNNILKSNYVREVLTLRATDVSQITTDNIGLKFTYPVDRFKSVMAYGKTFYDTNGDVVNANATVDLTKLVVLEDYYNTLSDLTSYDNRNVDTKNNHLSYKRGGYTIDNLAYTGEVRENWLSNNDVIRALYEAMATALSREYGVIIPPKKMNDKRIDGGKLDDDVVYFIVEYMTFGETNAVIQKDNQEVFEEKIIRKLNANERVNNADMLGSYARQKVNAVGGTQKAVSGITNNPDLIPKLASKDDDYRVVNITKYSGRDEVRFIATLVKDYLYESEYVGIDSDRRLYRVPKDDYVDRVDKALNMLYFNKEAITGNNTSFNLAGLVSILTTSALSFNQPKIAYLSFDNKYVSQYIDVNALGNTVEFRLAMLDNYSAGFMKINTVLDGKDFTYQRGVPYCDMFGRAENLIVEYYESLQNTTVANLNDYPSGQEMGYGLMGTLTYPVRKDARERIIISTQISFLSNHEDIIVYDGMAKYNRRVLDEVRDIKVAVLNYEPNKYDKFIDLTNVEAVFNNNTELYSEGDYFEFYASYNRPYAWFDNESKELLFVVKNVELGTNRIYYSGRLYEIGDVDFTRVDVGRIKTSIGFENELTDDYIETDDLKKKILFCQVGLTVS